MKTNPYRNTLWGFVKYRTTRETRAHNTCCATAYQLLCKRTSAVVRCKNLHLPCTFTIFSSNFLYMFRRLLLLPTSRDTCFITPKNYFYHNKEPFLRPFICDYQNKSLPLYR